MSGREATRQSTYSWTVSQPKHASTVSASQGDVGVLDEEGHIPSSRPHSGERKHCSRHRVTSTQGSVGLEAESRFVQADPTKIWTPENRLVCLWDINIAHQILRLETKPGSRQKPHVLMLRKA